MRIIVKDFLVLASHSKERLRVLEAHREYLKELATKISPSISETHGGTISDKTGMYGAQLADIDNRIAQEYNVLLDNINRLYCIVASVPNAVYRSILELRYIDGLEYYQIAEKLHYSERHINRLARAAIENLEMIYDKGIEVETNELI